VLGLLCFICVGTCLFHMCWGYLWKRGGSRVELCAVWHDSFYVWPKFQNCATNRIRIVPQIEWVMNMKEIWVIRRMNQNRATNRMSHEHKRNLGHRSKNHVKQHLWSNEWIMPSSPKRDGSQLERIMSHKMMESHITQSFKTWWLFNTQSPKIWMNHTTQMCCTGFRDVMVS